MVFYTASSEQCGGRIAGCETKQSHQRLEMSNGMETEQFLKQRQKEILKEILSFSNICFIMFLPIVFQLAYSNNRQ